MKNKPVLLMLIFLIFSFCFLIKAYSDDDMKTEKYFDGRISKYVDVVAGQVLVKFKEGVSYQTIKSLNNINKLEIIKEFQKNTKVLSILNPNGKVSVKDLVEIYSKDPSVEYVEPNFMLHALSTTPNDPYYSLQWALPLIKADTGWDFTKGSSSVIIAIIDTGASLSHEDLLNKIWNNPVESLPENKSNGIDDDGNGYVDDWQGWDFILISGKGDNDPTDLNGHGSHVSGISAAETDNGKGIAGCSWNPKLMVLRVLNALGSGSVDYAISAIYYAANNGAKILNMSLGSYSYSSSMNDAVQYAHNKGCVIVAAAGNDGNSTINYPAGYDNVIGVASVDKNDSRSSFSNYNNSVDICAPGGDGNPADEGDILSCYLNNQYAYIAGTSMATPYVSGLAALVFSQNSGWTNTQVENRLMSTTDDLGQSGWDSSYGYGRINLYKALNTSTTSETIQVRTYPNPFKIGQSSGITFDQLSGDEKINIYTISGDLVISKILQGAPLWLWDVKNSSGNNIERGIYLYVITKSSGQKTKGKIAILN